MAYRTVCGRKGCHGDLVVSFFTAETSIPLYPDGFSTTDCKNLHTSDEVVTCTVCGANYTLDELDGD